MFSIAARLPPEIVSIFLQHLARQDVHDDGIDYSWLSAAQTCQAWRNAALGFATLWALSMCSMRTHEGTKCVLDRSKDVPLTFIPRRGLQRHWMHPEHIQYATHNIDRVRVFKTHAIHYDAAGNIPTNIDLDCFALMLIHSNVYQLTVIHLHRWFPVEFGLAVPDVELKAPALEVFLLDGLYFSFTAPSLRILEIVGLPKVRALTSTRQWELWLPGFLEAVRKSPRLIRLVLRHVLTNSYQHPHLDVPSNTSPVSLPLLSVLQLDDRAFSLEILPYLEIPSGANVEIRDAHISMRKTLTSAASYMRASSNISLILEETTVEDADGDPATVMKVTICAIASTQEGRADQVSLVSRPLTDAEYGVETRDVIEYMAPLLRRQLRHLDIVNVSHRVGRQLTAHSLCAGLAEIPEVTHVHISVTRHGNHILALSDCGHALSGSSHEEYESSSEVRMRLPGLTNLSVHGLVCSASDFDEHVHVKSNDVGKPASAYAALQRYWSDVVRVLRLRYSSGLKLRVVTLCHPDPVISSSHPSHDCIFAADERWKALAECFVDRLVDVRGRNVPCGGGCV